MLSVFALAPTPVAAGGTSIWDLIDHYVGSFRRLVLLSGYVPALDLCENGAPLYTAFLPLDDFVDDHLRTNGLTLSAMSGFSGLADQFVADHVVNGYMSPDQFVNSNVAFLRTWSGRNIVKQNVSDFDDPEVGVNIAVNDQFIIFYRQACNGIVYFLYGDNYGPPSVSVANRTVIEPTNFAGTRRGAVRPERSDFYAAAPETSELPDTR